MILTKLKKFAPLFRGLAAVFAALLALLVAAIPVTRIDEVRTAIDGIFGISSRVQVKPKSDIETEEYALCTDGYFEEYALCTVAYSEGSIAPLAYIPPPANPDLAAPQYEEFTPAWEYVLSGLVIGFGVLTGIFAAAWLAAEIVPMFVENKENN